ncbi:uncharacterized protein LOC118801522 [Colossoma macropomum]|uniref:uncharacterized protein LOC118801522 n=1 Tax=Colossoma macropomum TaxID=42526 RepID=UPI0018652444|nr:uncharacterized protein LOC118801522 [Colossoma macropomum]
MKIQFHFCLLLLCGAAEGFIDKLVDLGQNVTLNCEIDIRDVYWFLMKPSQPPLYILRSFAKASTVPVYSNSSFSKRFSLQINSSLVIHNITLNELGIYYCILNETPPKISTGIRILHTNDHHNQTVENQQLRNETQNTEIREIRLWQSLLIMSGLQICVLIIAVTGVIVSHCKESPNNQLQLPDSTKQTSGVQNMFSVILQEGVQTGHRSSFTVVEFTQLSPVL